MTRLTHNHIADIPTTWDAYTMRLKERTGLSLFSLACRALNLDEQNAQKQCQGQHIAVIPLNSGEGLIQGFDVALQSIATYLGFEASILPENEAGFSKFHAGNFDINIWADDTTFIAEHKKTMAQVDNNVATGWGFAEALHALLDTQEETILVRGCGNIGRHAALHLLKRGYKVLLCDVVPAKAKNLAVWLSHENNGGFHVDSTTPSKVREYITEIYALFDAAPNPATNDDLPVSNATYIAAPAVPCLWNDTRRLWHDPLQLGTAIMLVAATTATPCTV